MSLSSTPVISIIVGSTRPVRIGRQLADSIAAIFSTHLDAEVRVLDLAEIGLPLLDEPLMAAMHQYQNPHTLAWARAIEGSDGVVFLTPQYNAGYPGGLKNAIDYLYAEWKGRPAGIISYGAHGGAMAAAQLRQVLEFIGLDLVADDVALTIRQDDYTPAWSLGDCDDVVARSSAQIEALGDAVLAMIQSREPAGQPA